MVTKFTSKEDAEKARKWHVVDASGVTLGRLASEVAALLRGKHKPDFCTHMDTGDYVVVVNAEKVRLTGKKLSDKIYYKHTSYIGNMKAVSAEDMLVKAPKTLVEAAVYGMLPKDVLGHHMRKKLKVYIGATHPHTAQTPAPYKLKYAVAQ